MGEDACLIRPIMNWKVNVMKRIMPGIIILLVSIMPGCVSMPDPINTAYLSEIKSDESEKIQNLEKAILVKKSERDEAAKIHAVSVAEEAVARKTVVFLEQKSEVYGALEKLYSLQNDNAALNKNKLALEALRLSRADQDRYIRYAAAKSVNRKAALDVSEAEMSVAVWELNCERSRVARGYQDRRPEEFGEKKSGIARYFQNKSKIDPKEYEKYLVKQREIAKENRETYEKTLKELQGLEQFKTLKYVVE